MMFFPDKVKAFAEAPRVLARGGFYIFSTWDRLSENEFADVVMQALESVFPDDPPRFMERTPHGHYDTRVIERYLLNAGFANPPEIVAVDAISRAASARMVALAYCQGSPWRNEIEARDPARMNEATDASEAALASRSGAAPPRDGCAPTF